MLSLKDMAVNLGPVIKKVMEETGKLLVREAVSRAGEKAASEIKKAPEKIDQYIDRKQEEAIKKARNEAELFMSEQMEILEKRVGAKLDEIEGRLDEKIVSYYRKFLALILASGGAFVIFTLFFLYVKKRMGL